jgi:7-cyano-7-deazaguanine reductase|tara:strand:- start:571 stop:1155 length:585 start_codon:yes stop_codon:yes gene_type:complete
MRQSSLQVECPYLIVSHQTVQDALTPSNPGTYHCGQNPVDIRTEAPMATIQELKAQYEGLDQELPSKGEEAIDPSCLLTFQYEYPNQQSQVEIDTDEFTAVCPWTGLPDYGVLTISYVPGDSCIELKSLKYYLLSYRDVGIVQEHAANRILNDLVAVCQPRSMKITLDYKVRGGLHTAVSVEYEGERNRDQGGK